MELIDTINFYYNEQNLLETIVSWTLNSENIWTIKDSIRYIFNDDNSLNKESGFYWKENIGLFPDYENIYTYNNDGSIDEVTYYNRFDESSSRWKDKTTERYRYHPFNSLKDLLYIDSIPPYGETEFVRRVEFRYDESIDYDQIRWNRIKTQPYYENHMLMEYYDHNGFHLLNERKQYFYSENNSVSVQDTDIENELIQVIPNPARESVKVKSNLKLLNSIFKIYNTQGLEVHSMKIQNDSLIEISHLSQGQYFYKIFFDGKVYTGKLIKL